MMSDNNPKNKTDTRTEIVTAARTEFLAHGYEGARLQKIAGQIGVTKAMIHYYFNTKKELFEHVYRQLVESTFSGLSKVLEEDVPLFKKIEQLVSFCLDKVGSDPEVLGFILTESNRNPQWLLPIFDDQVTVEKAVLARQIEEAASDYIIASVDPNELLLNIFSLCYFPAMSASINRSLLANGDKESVDALTGNRKGIVLDTILNWLTA